MIVLMVVPGVGRSIYINHYGDELLLFTWWWWWWWWWWCHIYKAFRL